MFKKVSIKNPTNWSEWAKSLRGLGKELWNDIDPVEYVHDAWHNEDDNFVRVYACWRV